MKLFLLIPIISLTSAFNLVYAQKQNLPQESEINLSKRLSPGKKTNITLSSSVNDADTLGSTYTSKVDRGSLRAVIAPKDDIRLSSQVDGIIIEYLKEEGDSVEKGEPIVHMDDRMEQAEVDKAEANLSAANAEHTRALKEFNRINTLYKEEIVSEKQLDEATYQLDTAASHQKQAQALWDFAQVQKEYKTIASPIRGIFFKKNKSVGESIMRLEVVARVIDTHSLEMVLYCGPQLFGSFKVGQLVQVKLLDGPFKGSLVDAKVEYVDSIIDSASGTFRIKLSLEPSEKVTAGLAGLLIIEEAQRS